MRKLLVMAMVVCFVFLGINLASAQDEEMSSELQWVWGEVVNQDPEAGSVTLKYMDYDSGSENQMIFNIDEGTAYENVTSLDDIQLGDLVGIEYSVDSAGNNIAKNISVGEKEPVVMEEAVAVTE